MKKKSFFLILFFVFLLVTSVLVILRSYKGSNDFDTFYEAGKAVLTGEGVYYPREFYGEKGGISPFLYAPVIACFFSLFALFPLWLAAVVWHLCNIILCFVAFFLCLKLLDISRNDFFSLWKEAPRYKKILYAIAFFALVLDNLAMAQINILIFVLCLWSVYFWKQSRSWNAGFVLSAAVFIKMTPLFFCFYFFIKRAWRILFGCFLGAVLFTVLLPTIIFGPQTNYIYHRQWLGRTLKPSFIQVLAPFLKGENHPLKKSYTKIRHEQLTRRLIDKNQGLEATLTRYFLKDRNRYAWDHELPIYVAQRYKNLPVVLGGLSREHLDLVIRMIQAGFMAAFILLTGLKRKLSPSQDRIWEISLIFLTMTLLSPLARSHQFILWVFPLMAIFCRLHSSLALKFVNFALALFFLQAFPFGKAMGMGTWANLILWFVVANVLAKGQGLKNERVRLAF